MADWASFSFGEDIRHGLRAVQDLKWSKASVDGRAHVSTRETVIAYRDAALKGILSYYGVFELMRALYPRINPFIVSIIASFAYKGHGKLSISLSMDIQLINVDQRR
jgi:hypothetical protein